VRAAGGRDGRSTVTLAVLALWRKWGAMDRTT
jgi:hypothetical protein